MNPLANNQPARWIVRPRRTSSLLLHAHPHLLRLRLLDTRLRLRRRPPLLPLLVRPRPLRPRPRAPRRRLHRRPRLGLGARLLPRRQVAVRPARGRRGHQGRSCQVRRWRRCPSEQRILAYSRRGGRGVGV